MDNLDSIHIVQKLSEDDLGFIHLVEKKCRTSEVFLNNLYRRTLSKDNKSADAVTVSEKLEACIKFLVIGLTSATIDKKYFIKEVEAEW